MKSRKARKQMLKGLGLCGLCLATRAVADNQNYKFLRKTKAKKPKETSTGSSSMGEKSGSRNELAKMEDLWAQAASAALLELETERILRSRSSDDFSMSMPSQPPSGPSAPSPRPTRRPSGPPVDCLQGRSREEYIFDLIEQVTPPELLNDVSTPQGLAFNYLANEDPHLSNPCVSQTIEQRYGLTTLFYATQGEGWVDRQGWLGEDQECLWFGIDCLGGNPDVVTRLTLSNNNLVGVVPEEIGTIEELERIDLYSNTVTGTLPTTLSSLTRLILLDVEQNLLSGTAIPPQVVGLRSLLAYRASDNFLSGTIPTEITSLSHLQQLWLATNQLSGTLPTELAAPTALESIFLYENTMEGTMPTELGQLSELEDLRLYRNTIQNGIPSELFAATKLETLQLQFNFLSGALPTEIGALTALTDLRLDTNGFSGTLPTEMVNLSLLENLIIHTNLFSGQIPNIFANMDSLDFLDAANNLFFGSIPESVFQTSSIRLLYLSNNTLSGTIPSDFSRPSSLRDLYLDGNGLTGAVPPIAPGALPDLNEFLVHFNFLSGSMPQSICDLRGSGGNLDDLFSDCGGLNPEIECEFPGCCNRCFEGGNLARRRNLQAKGRKLASASSNLINATQH